MRTAALSGVTSDWSMYIDAEVTGTPDTKSRSTGPSDGVALGCARCMFAFRATNGVEEGAELIPGVAGYRLPRGLPAGASSSSITQLSTSASLLLRAAAAVALVLALA